MTTEDALEAATRVIQAHDGRTDHVLLEAEEFAGGWLVFVHPRAAGMTVGGVNLVVDRQDGTVRPIGSSINPSLLMADYGRFRATTPAENLVPSSHW